VNKVETKRDDNEVRGKKSIKEHEKNDQGVYVPCDRSGKNALVGTDNFIDNRGDRRTYQGRSSSQSERGLQSRTEAVCNE
jgi:hypothetical protein